MAIDRILAFLGLLARRCRSCFRNRGSRRGHRDITGARSPARSPQENVAVQSQANTSIAIAALLVTILGVLVGIFAIVVMWALAPENQRELAKKYMLSYFHTSPPSQLAQLPHPEVLNHRPNGRLLAFSNHRLVTVAEDGMVRIWDLSFHDPRLVAVVRDGMMRIWDLSPTPAPQP
jgi:hypothetical protein